MDRNTPKDKYGYAFDPNSVANLKKIIDETGADIVISSSSAHGVGSGVHVLPL